MTRFSCTTEWLIKIYIWHLHDTENLTDQQAARRRQILHEYGTEIQRRGGRLPTESNKQGSAAI